MINRKGVLGEGVLFIPFFITLALIAGGIWGALILFYGSGYDYRYHEANVLLDEVKDCFSEDFANLNGILSQESFFERCPINREVILDGDHFIYYNNTKGGEFSSGVEDFKIRCFLDARYKKKELPLCVEFNSANGDYFLIGSSQNSRRVLS